MKVYNFDFDSDYREWAEKAFDAIEKQVEFALVQNDRAKSVEVSGALQNIRAILNGGELDE